MPTAMTLEKNNINTPKKRGKYTVCVVGCGRRGLPHACLFAEAGFKVIGVDADQQVINLMKMGRALFAKPKLNAILKKHVKNGMVASPPQTMLEKLHQKATLFYLLFQHPLTERKNPIIHMLKKRVKMWAWVYVLDP